MYVGSTWNFTPQHTPRMDEADMQMTIEANER